MTEHAFLTAREVADYLRTTIYTVRELIKTGKLKGRMVGKEYRISKRAFDAYLDTFENASAPSADDDGNPFQAVVPEWMFADGADDDTAKKR